MPVPAKVQHDEVEGLAEQDGHQARDHGPGLRLSPRHPQDPDGSRKVGERLGTEHCLGLEKT